MAWMLSGNDVVRTPKQTSAYGRHSTSVSIFRRDADGRLIERIDADRAVPARRRLAARAASAAHRSSRQRPRSVASLFWDGRIDVAALPLIASDIRDLRSVELLRLIRNDGYGQRPADRFRTWLQARIASALVPALMIFLAVALAQRFRRTGGIGTLLLVEHRHRLRLLHPRRRLPDHGRNRLPAALVRRLELPSWRWPA